MLPRRLCISCLHIDPSTAANTYSSGAFLTIFLRIVKSLRFNLCARGCSIPAVTFRELKRTVPGLHAWPAKFTRPTRGEISRLWSRSGSGPEENGTQIEAKQNEFFLPRFVSDARQRSWAAQSKATTRDR